MKLRIKEISQEKGIPFYEIAEKIGVHRVTISNISCGSKEPSIGILEKIAQALDVPVWHLFVDPSETYTCPKCGAKLKLVAVE